MQPLYNFVLTISTVNTRKTKINSLNIFKRIRKTINLKRIKKNPLLRKYYIQRQNRPTR